MFQPKFWDAVECGSKRQTVRPVSKRPVHVGDYLSLRGWTGKPYRSKQFNLNSGFCETVLPVEISETGVKVCGFTVGADKFAIADGFEDFAEMLRWFQANHALPFRGVCIGWTPERL